VLESEPEAEPPPNGTAAGTALSTDVIDRGCPDCRRSLRRSRSFALALFVALPVAWALACPLGLTLAFDVDAGSLYSLGGSQVIAIDVVVRADASGSYGGQATLGTSPALPDPSVPPLEEDEPSDDDPDDVPVAAGTSTHSRGVYRELDCPAIAMIR